MSFTQTRGVSAPVHSDFTRPDTIQPTGSAISEPLDTIQNVEGLLAAELKPEPLVTVVIPTYNRANVILRALETAFAQTYRNLEIIVVDDGSTDDTAAVLAPYWERIHYIYQSNQGASAARNRGIQEAKGEYIAFLDSDDEWLPAKVAKQIELMEAQPDLSFVACLSTVEKRTYHGFEDHDTQFMRFIRHPFPQNMTRYVVRRDCLLKHGVFDTSIQGPEDWDLWLRLLQQGCRFGYVNEPLMVYISSDDSISSRPYAMMSGEAVIRKRYVETLPSLWQRVTIGLWFRARSYMNAAVCFREEGKRWKSLGYLLTSMLISPFGPRNNLRLPLLVALVRSLIMRPFGAVG